MASSGTPVIQVAVPSPLRRQFDYLPPQNKAAAALLAGMRVRVPFGRQQCIGIIVGKTAASELPRHRLRRIIEVIDTAPVFDNGHLEFLLWSAGYYHHPVGEVIMNSLPTLLRQGKPAGTSGVQHWSVTPAGIGFDAQTLTRSPRQRLLLQLLQQHPGGLTAEKIDALDVFSRPALNALVEKELVQVRQRLHHEMINHTPAANITLTPEQGEAIKTVSSSLHHYGCFLLNGVTGSGKTEIYMHLMHEVIQRQQQVLILLPEIGLTPQFIRRLEQGTGTPVAVYHSGLSDRERLNTWLLARDNRVQVILGTRSAIWIPLQAPGLFIVDEEHDPSYKQQEGFRYSARDLALVRARNANCPVILGSATPSLESINNRSRRDFREIRLSQRVADAGMPRLLVLDLKHSVMNGALCGSLHQHIRKTLDKRQQVLIFQNRRGYSPAYLCHECGWLATCERCDKLMTLHKSRQILWCHHCDRQSRIPDRCPGCRHDMLIEIGHGTERIEEDLKTACPDANVVRIDRDTTRRKGSMVQMNEEILSGKADILVGTQMLAKGHHFPGVTLVVIIDVDSSLYSTDFRATERMAQLITQVSGRAGRGKDKGTVIIQTHYPEHPLLRILLDEGYMAFTSRLLEERRESGLPPFRFMALLRAEANRLTDCESFLHEARTLLNNRDRQLDIAGPLPAPMERKAGRYRMQLMLLSNSRRALNESLHALLPGLEGSKLARRVRWSIDVDPQDMM